ncbi:MAG: hypothetical protein IJF08_05595 [Clostridia bacterium]|nr:hypothetical protein [Clostridia bacterium]
MLKIKVTSSEFRRFSLHAAGQKTAYIIIVPDFGAIVNTENEKSEESSRENAGLFLAFVNYLEKTLRSPQKMCKTLLKKAWNWCIIK